MTQVFYGWFVVAAAFVVTFVGTGSAYTFSSFVESLQRDFAASRGAVSLVFSIAGFLYFGLGVVSGPLADRWGARKLTSLGMAFVGGGLMLASQAHTTAQVYAAYSVGIGCAYVPALGVVQRWFVKRRGCARCGDRDDHQQDPLAGQRLRSTATAASRSSGPSTVTLGKALEKTCLASIGRAAPPRAAMMSWVVAA